MGLFDAIIGGASGFLLGGPAGAAAGAFGGLVSRGGESGRVTSSIMRRDYSPEERQVYELIQRRLPGMLERLGPDQQQEFINQTMNILNTQGEQKLDKFFADQEAKMSAAMKRTGGDLGSVALYRRKELAGERARAENEMRAGNLLAANQIGLARSTQLGNDVRALAGIGASYDAMRNIGQTQVTRQPSNFFESAVTAAGQALTSPDSYFGRRWGAGKK